MKKTATASRPMARVSIKDTVLIFKNLRNRPINKAKNYLNELIDEKKNIQGKHFTGASKEILDVIEEAETNAESTGLDTEKLFVKEARVNKAFTFILPKSRWSHRGRKAKLCQIIITLGER